MITRCNKILEYAFYALFFFIPLVFTNTTSELFELNKIWICFGLTIVIAASWGTKMIIEKHITIQKTPLDIPILLFLLSQGISTVLSLDSRISLWGYYSRFNGGLLSTLCYIFLYYAFVSNYHVIEQGIRKRFAPLTKALFLITGIIIFPLGIYVSTQLATAIAGSPDSNLLLGTLPSFIFFVLAMPPGFLKRILFMNLIAGLLVALWGLPAHFGNDPSCLLFRGSFDVSCWTEAFHPTVRIFSTLGQPAWLAAYLSVLLPITLAYFLQYRHKSAELAQLPAKQVKHTAPSPFISYQLPVPFFLGLITLFYLDLIYTNTRAGFLAFWIGLIIFWGIFFLTQTKKKLLLAACFMCDLLIMAGTIGTSHFVAFWFIGIFTGIALLFFFAETWKKTYVLVMSLLVVLTFFNYTPLPEVNPYFSLSGISSKISTQTKLAKPTPATQPVQTAGTVLESGGTESGAIRKIVWKGAIAIWKANPVFGTGVETFAFAYYRFRPIEHNQTSEWDYLYNKAHNEYLNYLATTGAFGLGSYLSIIAVFFFLIGKWLATFIKSRDLMTEHLKEILLVTALMSGYITILISNFFGFSVVIINLYFFLIPAFVLFLIQRISEQNRFIFPANNTETYNPHVNPYQWTGIVAMFLIAFLCLRTLHVFWQADVAYALGHNFNLIGEYQRAYPLLDKAVSLRGNEPVFMDDLALNNAQLVPLLLQNKQELQATQLAQRALLLSDDLIARHPNNILIWKNRVRIFYALSQANPKYLANALEAMQVAKQLAPTDAKVTYNLGILYGQNDQIEKGINILRDAIQLRPNYKEAYFAIGLFYNDQGMKNGRIVDQTKQQKAVEAMQYILTNISPNDQQVKDTLTSWEKK